MVSLTSLTFTLSGAGLHTYVRVVPLAGEGLARLMQS